MIIAPSIAALREFVDAARARGQRIGFVPTMGNLHAGHACLIEAARARCDCVAVSIYINPLQFGPQEDFASYPRTPDTDRALLERHGADILFFPDDATMYPRGREAQTRVVVPAVGDILCGASRPGHFAGVTTVVNRLFNLLRPDVAYFGKKDYQQLLLIRLMVADLAMSVAIEGVDTVRADDGLALSSRNQYLNRAERAIAHHLFAELQSTAARLEQGMTRHTAESQAMAALQAAGFAPEYISVRRQTDLGLPGPGDRDLVILAAARLGRTRLIDNVELGLKLPLQAP